MERHLKDEKIKELEEIPETPKLERS
jgi:hypothetical protein